MNSNTTLALSLGIGIPILIAVLAALILCCCCRSREGRSRNHTTHGYNKVNKDEDFDADELEFQRMIESRNGAFADEDFQFGLDDDNGINNHHNDNGDDVDEVDLEQFDLGFNAKEQGRLNMLDKLRNRLVHGTTLTGGDTNDIGGGEVEMETVTTASQLAKTKEDLRV
jgi:hypothetical protein